MDETPILSDRDRLVEAYELALSDFTDALCSLSFERECFDVPTRTKQLVERVVATHSRRVDVEFALESFIAKNKGVLS